VAMSAHRDARSWWGDYKKRMLTVVSPSPDGSAAVFDVRAH
jgi:hypothetical protein